ncbi:MAG: type II toxin-antitoxin system Phd/YefM family antitoxin [Candidatus Hodarchaeota archaeon]
MQITSAEFRSKCFKILENIQNNHIEVVITKRGKPVAKLTHIDTDNSKDPLLGALVGVGRTVEDLTEPVADSNDWEID